MFEENPQKWAQLVFSSTNLGDPRRTKRLVKVATDLATHAGHSLCKASADPASIEGAYRFIRNGAVDANEIMQAGFRRTDEIVKQRPLVLALQDTTGLSYRHSVCEELGSVNSSNEKRNSSKGRTLYAHSTLMLDATNENVLGLAQQNYWHRETKKTGKGHALQCRGQSEKESYKWQRNTQDLKDRLGSINNIIEVCDREADMYEYLDYQLANNHRFVVRASDNRRLVENNTKLFEQISNLDIAGYYDVHVKQKGGRKARTAKIAISYTSVNLRKPQRAKAQEQLALNIIVCREVNAGSNGLCWLLYTSEKIASIDDARTISRYYELRWRIEEFHKVWKTEGTQVESLRMQSRDNLIKVAVIQAFIAVRLFQLKELVQNREEAKEIDCRVYFSNIAWKLLWSKIETKKKLPDTAPSLYWAYYALAKLGRWHDSARNGRVGTKAIWEGWITLMNYVEAYEILKDLDL